MSWRDAITANGGLFKLDWILQPEILEEQVKRYGLHDRLTLEISAWCAELNAQLEPMARRAGLDLILMGGNATALRMDVTAQRGSRDNDYLTTATEGDLEGLMRDLREHFSALPHPLFTYRRLEPEDALPLPLVTYVVDVPALSPLNESQGTLGVKLEFHLSDPSQMPEAEEVEGSFLAIGQFVRARMPRVPHQLVLKAMTLRDPPIGIDDGRIDAIPRQLYDLDDLTQRIVDPKDWETLLLYGKARYTAECEQRQLSPKPENPGWGILSRLREWVGCADERSEYWELIRAFQSAQLARGQERHADEWSARVQRLIVFFRCLTDDSLGLTDWRRSLAVEDRLQPLEGKLLRRQRADLGRAVGIPGKRVAPNPRVTLWAFLADADDLNAALDSVNSSVSEPAGGAD